MHLLAAGSVAAVSVAIAACGGSDTPTNGTIGAPVAVTPAVVASPAYVRLARGAHPLARSENDIGLLDPETRISNLSIVFKSTAAQSRDLEALRAAQVDPSSPSYRAWLTPEEYAARFGASADVLAKTNAWLAGQGLEVHAASRLGTRVTFSGKVADLQKTFHAEMHRYLVGGETHYAMSTAPAIPTDLADVVLAVHNTHDIHPRPMIHSAPVEPEYTGTHGDGLGPSDWATVYDVTPLYSTGVTGTPLDGTGVTIAIVGVAEISQSDIAAFRATFGLPAANVTTTLVPNTGAAAAGTQGTGEEAFLDVEWAGGIAKGAAINYVYVGGDDADVDDATYYAIEQNIAPILSESWGGCEAGLTPSDADVVAVYGSAANVLGITYLAAAGDSGAAGCIGAGPSGLYVSLPAAYPGVTSVGGTEFPNGSLAYDTNGNVTGYSALEEVWDEGNDPNSGVGAGGGGISILFPRPSYQSALATCPIVGSLPTSVTPSAMRQVPDLSVSAASGNNAYFIECSVSQTTHDCAGVGGTPRVRAIGGTSASTPSFAGVVALIEQATGTRLGNINPMLYEIATTTPTAYHDITIGNNEVVCTPGTDPGCASSGLYGFAAAMGYDCATGIGSIDGVKLLEAWAALTPTTTTIAAMPTASSEGANVSLSATVTALSPSAALLDGTVTFAFESYLANGEPDLSWTLGTDTLVGGATMSGAAAIAPAPIPPGLINPAAQYVDVYAMYGGDEAHLASTSPKVRITFAAIDFAISPATATVAPGGTLQFMSTGGIAPVKWYVDYDTTCDQNDNCSTLDETTGAFVAGPMAGSVVVAGLDNFGAEGLSHIAVQGTSTDGGTAADAGDAGPASDAGSDAAADGGTTAIEDGGEAEADGGPADMLVKEGCACDAAGRKSSPSGALVGIGLGLVVALRRRRGASLFR